jgi:nitronate monooxygenase
MTLIIKGKKLSYDFYPGAMGAGITLGEFAGAAAAENIPGIISTAGIDRFVSRELGIKVNTYDAVVYEVKKAKKIGNNGPVGVNIMTFLQQDREVAAQAAVDARSDFIISGAGLPMYLPGVKNLGDTALIPIVSSLKALELIYSKWEKWHHYRPDAVVVAGPKCAGHNGHKISEIDSPDHQLEAIFPPIKDFAQKHGDFPVIVAGGIFDRNDIQKFINLGADGTQMGTRFLGTDAAGASAKFKRALVDCEENDIIVVEQSPCAFPLRILKQSPRYQSFLRGPVNPVCDKKYLLQKDKDGNSTICFAKTEPEKYFCLCAGLLGAAGYSNEEEVFTVGSNAHKIKKIVSVKELIDELKGINL